jgi:hypothetical protein
MRRSTTLFGVYFLAAAALSAQSPAFAVSSLTGPLTVVGNHIEDANGATVVLRGLQRDGTEGGPSTSPATVSADELAWIGHGHDGSWNAGVVRVPVGSAQWTGACPSLANDAFRYRAAIDAEVTTLTGQGIVALLDLHTVTAGCTSIDRHAMPDAPVTQTFWNDAAHHYAGNPLVAFELYNEPHFVPDAEWLNGTSGATAQDCDLTQPQAPLGVAYVQQLIAQRQCELKAPKYQAVGMQELYDLVAVAAPNHLIVVDGPGYAANPPSTRLNPDHGELVYGLHPYTCSVPGAACDVGSKATANTALLDRWKPLAAQAPVFVTEMGWPVYPKGDGTGYVDGASYYRQTIDYLDRQSPPWGFVAFAFDGGTSGGFSLLSSNVTYAPNTTGQPVFDRLHQP